MTTIVKPQFINLIGLMLCGGLLVACNLTMRDQPRLEPYEASPIFADQASLRPQVPNTIARGQLKLDEHLHKGRENGTFAKTFPFPITLEMLERGQERYDIFCAPCHGVNGDGNGIITEYGMRVPTSFHAEELRIEPPGYYFDLITNGTRVMPSYAARITPEDRWAIVAYIQALQLSQNVDAEQVPPDKLPSTE